MNLFVYMPRLDQPLRILILTSALLTGRLGVTASPVSIILDGAREGRTFEGIGALSAGASSRLLIEYPEPYRSEVLDYLFKPNYGAGFQHLKVEIGGDVNSTDGCEPSHMHRRNDENYHRGYEWWLMQEAKRRNPAIFLDCLEWGAPSWIRDHEFFSQDNADYITRFIKGARTVHGLDIDYVGVWNETRPKLGWIKLLRRTLDSAGLRSVQIVGADDIDRWNLADVMASDRELARAVQVVGVHYPKFKSTASAQRCGKPIWSSEDGPWKGNWAGAKGLAKQYNRNYIEGRMTKTIIWSPVSAYYDNLPLPSSGVMRANTPWSGHYQVQPALWATAHTTQFAQPGWQYLEDGGCALLPNGGSYVSLKAPNGVDYSIILETVDATNQLQLAFQVMGGLSTGSLHVWRSQPEEQFVRLADVTPSNGSFTLTVDAGSIYSISTTVGQQKGAATPPPPTLFPLTHFENYESCPIGGMPRFFSVQAGTFEVARRADGKGQCLRQTMHEKGIEWPFHLDPFPEGILGDPNWQDYEVRTDVRIEKRGFVSLFGRIGAVPQSASPPNGYWLRVDEAGEWELGTAKAALAAGKVPFQRGHWHQLRLAFKSDRIGAFVDDRPVASLTDETYSCGMVGIGSGWHKAEFDNLALRADPSELNLAFAKRVTASSCAGPDDCPAAVVDGDGYTSRWTAADGKCSGEWLELDLGAPRRFNSATIKQYEDRITRYRLQRWSGTEWLDCYQGDKLGSAPKTVCFPVVTADRVRLLLLEARDSPSIWEFELRHRTP